MSKVRLLEAVFLGADTFWQPHKVEEPKKGAELKRQISEVREAELVESARQSTGSKEADKEIQKSAYGFP